MKAQSGAFLAIGFVLAIFSLVVLDFTERIQSLNQQLDEVQGELQETHRRMASFDQSVQSRLQTQNETLAALLPSPRNSKDFEVIYDDVLYPSVQVSTNGGVGGGTILYSLKGHTYAVTAFHVVQKCLPQEDPAQTPESLTVKTYDERGRACGTVEAEIVEHDAKKDLALLRLKTDRLYDNVARPASRETLRRIKVFTPVYAVGCPLGHDPLPTLGEVATLHKEVSGEHFWMMNAPTIYGNSGGGIFHRETRELIGVSVMICTYDNVISTPVPHLGIMLSMGAVYDWLDATGYSFIYDPRITLEECEQARVQPPSAPVPSGAVFPEMMGW